MPPFMENLLAVLRWRDVFDILLNSYVLFRLYIILRGTRLFRIFIFFFVLFVLHQFTATSGMILTHTVMQGVAALTAIGVLIVFRYEIRSIFQSKGIKDIFWRITPKQSQTPVEMIAESVYRLAQQRKGALIVLPARQAIDGLVQGGVPLNGAVSREMIESIFWPGNPIHDGAAVIDGEKIVRVASILPLTDQSDLPSRYGTRHRAALGLSELSDAVIVVVSEERGEVSIAFEGRIEAIASRSELERRLRAHAGLKSPAIHGPFQKKLTVSLAALLSFVTVSSIWFSYSVGVVISLTTVEVPVEYIKRDTHMTILETSSATVKIQLSGSRQLLNNLNPNQVKVRFDLANATAGDNWFTISEKDIVLPAGALVRKIEPSAINVVLDVPGEKALPVQVDWAGILPKGVLIQGVRVVPERVVVEGAQMRLNRMDTIYTQPVTVDHLTETEGLVVPLALSPPAIKLAHHQPDTVRVHFTITPRSSVFP